MRCRILGRACQCAVRVLRFGLFEFGLAELGLFELVLVELGKDSQLTHGFLYFLTTPTGH